MKGYVVAIIPVEVTDEEYLLDGQYLPIEFEQDIAGAIDLGLSSPTLVNTYGPSEVWTLSAFVENGGKLTQDHSEDQRSFHEQPASF